jgi:hypothetical protein
MKSVITVQEAAELIHSGKQLFVAGDEQLLRQLPHGQWIGGTIPYFMGEDGGVCTHDALQVAVLPDFIQAAEIRFYEESELDSLPRHYKPNGFTRIIVPASSATHQRFAHDCMSWEGLFDQPLVGWIAGVDLKDLGKVSPQVFNGITGESSTTKAVAMHVALPDGIVAKANILNLFRQGEGDVIQFPEAGFEASGCLINGAKANLAAYLREHKIDTKLPLVADYMGAMVNVSIQAVQPEAGKVTFYAPVFPGVEYKVAAPVTNYEEEFRKEIESRHETPVFSCNCILNYLYAGLEGKRTGNIVGPITFGEIAYMLLNQTLVYLTFEKTAA